MSAQQDLVYEAASWQFRKIFLKLAVNELLKQIPHVKEHRIWFFQLQIKVLTSSLMSIPTYFTVL